MTELPSPKALLTARGLRSKHRLGQHFLTDSRLAARIAAAAVDDEAATVVEIGAGLGALTRELCRRAKRVTAIERDRELLPVLNEELADELASGRLELVFADARHVDYVALFGNAPVSPPVERRPHTRPGRRVLAGNLPYALTGLLLEKTVQLHATIDRAVYLVQLEVADRLNARPGTSDYGALSVFVQAAFDVERAFIVRRGAFYPQPNVDSALVKLSALRPPRAAETPEFRALVHGAFGQRRKTLRNAWRGVLGLSDEAISRAAERAGVALTARGETLDVDAFRRMEEEARR